MNNEDKRISDTPVKSVTTYHEKKIGKTLYRVTNVYQGKVDLAKTLEDLIVRKIVLFENSTAECGC